VHYYAREGYARHVQNVCIEVLKKRVKDPVLTFWKAFGSIQEGLLSEAIRDLQPFVSNPEVNVAVTAALLRCNELAKVPDEDAIIELQGRLEAEERSASDRSLIHLAGFYLYTGSKEKARTIAERVLRVTPDHAAAQTLLGWVILAQHEDEDYALLADEHELDDAMANFEAVADADPGDLNAQLGKARVLERRRRLADCQALLAEIHARFAWFVPALVERARLAMAQQDWDLVKDLLQRLLQADAACIPALSWNCLLTITRDGNNKLGCQQMQELVATINRQEPRNAELLFRTARLFRSVSCTDIPLLQNTFLAAERACQLKPENVHYLVELGYQKLAMDELQTASEKFQQTIHMDDLNVEGNAGSLEIQILNGAYDEAETQLVFLQEMFSNSHGHGGGMSEMGGYGAEGDSPTLLYLRGLLEWKRGNENMGLALLEQAIARHFEVAMAAIAAVSSSNAPEPLVLLDPSRITRIVRLLVAGAGGEPKGPTEAPNPLLAKCRRALDLLAKQAPGLVESGLLLARVLFLNGELDAAQRKAAEILRNNPEEVGAQLLICSVYAHQDKPDLALNALDHAVSSSFSVRETPLYHIVNARVLMAANRLDEAVKALETAMGLPGVRTPLTPAQRQSRAALRAAGRPVASEPTLHERVTLFLMMAEVLAKTSKLPDAPEAKKYIQDATREFEGTSEEVRVAVADCELAIAHGDIEGALSKLKKIPDTSPHFAKARMAMANIYLKHRRDKTLYMKCYLDLADRNPDYDSYCMLGEAFLQILEPEKAVRAFENAIDISPKDTDLLTKCARALVTSHDYPRSVEFYQRAISHARATTAAHRLQLELAELLLRLRQWPAASAAVNKCLERSREGIPASENLQLDVEGWLLLARTAKGQQDMNGFLETQTQALELQRQLLQRLRGELPEGIEAQRIKAAEICYELAEHHKKNRKFDLSMECYEESLRHWDQHAPSMLALARLQLANGDVDACQLQCVQLLKADPDNEAASVMLAELMFHKENYDTAIYHFQQLLERKPSHYGAMSQLVQLLRRAGRLEDVPKYFQQAEAANPKAAMEPGFHFCRGLYQRYINQPREALKELNLARKDTRWGTPSALHMAEIYLNPDNDAVWEEKENADTPESREAVATARSLLKQVRPQDTQSQRYRVLDCYALMAGKEKNEIEEALSLLLDMASQDPNNVPVLLAMATGFMMLKQTPKARNQLKRLQKIPYKPDEAEEFERGWLLLADIHIQGGKFDLAQDLCQRCLKYNKSCAKAWEILGQVMEREQAFKDAAEHYERAWKHENQARPQVGYKLAFNYLKAKRFVEAIDVCHRVMRAFPDYPRIRKEVLEKARQGLKP